ncbi:MAG: type II secretion system F family protein [Acidimicrobiia bacterium]|nr:type II secretion system F family protein [Acidimicrobiia bacterium]
MIWLVAASGAGAAMRLVLCDAPRRANTVELAAAGWPPARLRTASVVATSLVAGVIVVAGTILAGFRVGALAAVAVSVWVPVAAAPGLCGIVLSGYRARRDAALLEWLRRIRLYVAAGRPINDAAVEAAERVESPAFAPAATSINLALASGVDPLSAASAHFAGSAAETLVGTLAAAERGGAAATGLIDRLIAQAVHALEDHRRVRIEALGRSVAGTGTLAAITASAVVVLALLASVDIGV